MARKACPMHSMLLDTFVSAAGTVPHRIQRRTFDHVARVDPPNFFSWHNQPIEVQTDLLSGGWANIPHMSARV
jgi:hypothetical protein